MAEDRLERIKARQDQYRLAESRIMSDGHRSVFILPTNDVAWLVAALEEARAELREAIRLTRPSAFLDGKPPYW